MGEVLLKMEGICKSFPGVQALSGVRLELHKGEVLALIGENGAGKSTLMKILAGIHRKDAGRIMLKGREVDIDSPRTAQGLGISIIHQELNLMPHLTVAQNIFIGREPRKGVDFFLDENALNEKTRRLFEEMHLDMDPTTKVSDLTIARQQMVEIAKAFSFNSEVLVMDEPTAALTETEIEELFLFIHRLKAQGVGIIYISHRMEELKKISDRVTIMRDGGYVDTLETREATVDQIISLMVGRVIYETARDMAGFVGDEVVLEVKDLNRGNSLKNISFKLHKGEILGFAGLMGAGRTEVARAIFGADPLESGEVHVHGELVQIKSPYDAVRHGIGYLSEDRKRYGLVLGMDIETNVVLAAFKKFTDYFGWMNTGKIRETAERYVDALKIKTPDVGQRVKNLSGGNQQKVVIGKWLTRDCDILIFDEPTRGIDVGAKNEIYKLLTELVKQGKSIIMISSELPEILRMSERIIVMCESRITGELTASEATQENIMRLATQRSA